MENDFTVGLRLRHQRDRRKKLIRAGIFIFVGVISIYLIFNQFNKTNNSTTKNTQVKISSLEETVGNALEGTKGTYAIAVKNLKTGEKYYLDEHRVFETGSLYKLWIMAVVYQQIQNGQLTEDQVLSEDVATLNDKFNIDSDSAELTEGTITFTVRDALNQMITISHNYAALLLTEQIKLSSVATFLKDKGFSESIVGTNGESPTATASDIALFYEKLYKGELANKQYTDEMIGLLKNQQLNDGLPKYISDKSMVASKTGDIGWFKHDAGIVFTDRGDYIIVIMSESDNPQAAQERIALVSKAVFDYFANK
ncbi:serine hydrolase [Candidatus Daviesbacteria bacterium]|nr:serine hydrolase [Candidatus Daviesbacteria bacterium]